MAAHNPYAVSKASMGAGSSASHVSSETQVWRDGRTVVAQLDANLPPRCVKCNEPAHQPTKVRTLHWMHPALYLLFFAGLLVLIIVALVVRKKAEVDPGLCELHKKRRLFAITFGWFATLLGFGLIFTGFDSTARALCGVGLLIAALVVGMSMGRLVHARKIDKDEVRLGGFCRAYLDELPEYPG